MLKKFVLLLLAAAMSFGATACKKKPKDNTEEKKKAFQAEQRKKAIDNYQKLVQKYPDSEWAPKAQQRLQTLGSTQTSGGGQPKATPKK